MERRRLTIQSKYFGVAAASLLWVLAGCSGPSFGHRAPAGWLEAKDTIKTVQIVPAQVDVYEITESKRKIRRDDWSKQALSNVTSATVEELEKRFSISAAVLPADSLPAGIKENYRETRALYDAVNSSIIEHTYTPGPAYFREKSENFDYTLGREVADLNTTGADALLFVWGVDHIFSATEKANQVVRGIALGLMTGVAPYSYKMTYLSMALVDPESGSILWYNYRNTKMSLGTFDLREEKSAARMVGETLKYYSGENPNAYHPKGIGKKGGGQSK